jgi:uncharacterized protein
MTTTEIFWFREPGPSAELCRVTDDERGTTFVGTVLAVEDGTPFEIGYEVRTGADGATEDVAVSSSSPAGFRLRLHRDPSGRWYAVDGDGRRARQPMAGVDDCVDVDLGFTPATNTLPIRRLHLGLNEEKEIAALWLRFPDLTLLRQGQIYRRVGREAYLYRSGDFQAMLTVDGDGIVTNYDGLWRAWAVRRTE